jgi:rubrerythrin
MSITRRRLFAVSGAGGAAAVLAACGTAEEEASPERDVELLQAALDAEGGVERLYRTATEQSLDADARATVQAFGVTAREHVDRLRKEIEGAGGTPVESSADVPAGENVLDALTVALTDAIAAYHDAVGELSSAPLRRTVYELLAADAAQLAAIRGLLGSEQAPEAFVTGRDEPPLEAEAQQ